MPTPAAVIFDLGKVLVDFDYGRASARIAARGDTTPERVRSLIDHSPLLFRFETGLLSADGFFAEVREATGFSGHLTEFSEMFADIFSPIPSMIALQRDLRDRRIPTFIFSNTNELAVTHIRKRFPFFSEFDGYVLSFQHGAMKPDPQLYAVVEQVTGRRGHELLYLDDRPENVDTARTMGWQAIEHRDPAESLAAVRATGLLR